MSEPQYNVTRYQEIAELLEQILVKYHGKKANLAMIVLWTPRLSLYDPAAVTVALLEVLHSGEYPCYGAFYQRIQRILAADFAGLEDAGGCL